MEDIISMAQVFIWQENVSIDTRIRLRLKDERVSKKKQSLKEYLKLRYKW
jgi:hypothetical protein